MHFTSAIISSILATSVAARPRATSGNDPLPQKSHVTAFVVDENGNPSVECWEIATVSDSMQVKSANGHEATAHAISFARHGELEGLDVLTWPTSSAIWPPREGSDVGTANFDMTNTFNLFNIQGGLVNFNFYAARFGMASTDDETERHIFSLENGDDWFYFEDSSSAVRATSKATTKPYPFAISTVSGSETEMLRLRYNSRPSHKVIHKGACQFTGVHTGDEAQLSQSSPGHASFTVQVNLNEDL